MNRFVTLPLVAAIAVTAVAGSAIGAGDANHAAALKARQAQMQLQAYNIGILGEMAKGAIEYDAATASAAAKNLNLLANFDQTIEWPEGSVQGTLEGTRAAPAIWSDTPGFAAEWEKFAAATSAMEAAAGVDLVSLQGAIGAVGASCGSCHETYRGPKN